MKYLYPSDVTKLKYYMTMISKRHSGYITDALRTGSTGFFKADTSSGFALPIPDNLVDSTSANWTDQNDQSVETSLAKNVVEKSATAQIAAREATFQTGKIAERHSALLFDGMSAKTPSFQWDLIPANAQEASAIEGMIEELRIAQLPSVDGAFLEFPDIFYVEFVGLNYKLAPMVLMNVDVNYTPYGKFTAMSDGHLPAYQLSLSFSEVTSRNRQIYQNIR